MKVELEKTFALAVPVDAAWTFLQNIAGVAGCVPGAKITERRQDGHYIGTMTVRMGPASLSFKGDVEVLELNSDQRTLRLIGRGSDTSGGTAASMDLTARVESSADGGSTLVGKSEVTVNGKAASFGGRMMNAVADQILKQFAANFAVEAGKLGSGVVQLPVAAAQTPGSSSAQTADPVQAPAPSPATSNELNVLALLWSLLRNWVRGLLKRDST